MMGVHGNGLTWMKPSPRSTVMEFFFPGGFAHDYEYTTRALGMVHYGFWGGQCVFSPLIIFMNDTIFFADHSQAPTPRRELPPWLPGQLDPDRRRGRGSAMLREANAIRRSGRLITLFQIYMQCIPKTRLPFSAWYNLYLSRYPSLSNTQILI
jgi:hypothetical protein